MLCCCKTVTMIPLLLLPPKSPDQGLRSLDRDLCNLDWLAEYPLQHSVIISALSTFVE